MRLRICENEHNAAEGCRSKVLDSKNNRELAVSHEVRQARIGAVGWRHLRYAEPSLGDPPGNSSLTTIGSGQLKFRLSHPLLVELGV